MPPADTAKAVNEHHPVEDSGALVDRERRSYRIGEFTDAHHRAFVEGAFRGLLKRAPTPAEIDAQLALLGSGATKAEVLGNLRWSPEGRAIGAHVAGLAPRYAMAKLRRVPVLGYLIDIPLNLAALPALARHQRASDAMVAAGDEALAQALRNLASKQEASAQTTHDLAARLHAIAADLAPLHEQAALARQRLDNLHAAVRDANLARDAQTRRLDEIHLALRGRIEVLEQVARHYRARLDDLEMLRLQLRSMNRWRDALDGAFARIEETAATREQGDAQAAEPIAQAMLQAIAPPYAAWAERLARRLAPGARVLAASADVAWSRALAAHGIQAIETDADDVQARWSRCADASADAASALALPALARAFALPALLGEIRRVVVPGGTVLLAFARDAAALRAALRGESPAALDVELVALALAAVGCDEIERIDANDVPALLARVAKA